MTSDSVRRASAAISRFEFESAARELTNVLGGSIESAEAHVIASVMQAQEGFAEKAGQHAGRAVALESHSRAAWTQVLTTLKMRRIDPARFLDAHRRYAEAFYADEAGDFVPDNRRYSRLRVGVLGADGHLALSRFLAFLKHSQHEIIFFYREKSRAAEFSAAHIYARHIGVEGDAAACARAMREESLDVVLDLAGHGPAAWLDVLARRVAPVQLTWLDYLATTGLPSVDYRITDWIADPLGNEAFHVEALARLPCAAWSYTAWPEAPPVAAAARPLALGSACIPLKFCDDTLALWNRVLRAIPAATLTLMGFLSERSKDRVRAHFDANLQSKLRLLPRLDVAAYLAELSKFAVALDPLPFSGGTSTLDCLWQGVPVITWPGALSHTRTSASLLRHIGLRRGVVSDEDGYVAAVSDSVGECQTLADRRQLRLRVASSSLGQPRCFARHFDNLLRGVGIASATFGNPVAVRHAAALANPLDADARRAFFQAVRLAA
jgi:protein O-GlcNAc transferase